MHTGTMTAKEFVLGKKAKKELAVPRTRKELLVYLWEQADLVRKNVNVYREGSQYVATWKNKDGKMMIAATSLTAIGQITFGDWEKRFRQEYFP